MITKEDYFDLIEKMTSIAMNKNSDYAGEKDFLKNFKMARDLGIKPSLGVAIRMSDKWSRIQELLQKDSPSVVDEKLSDTLLDLANYSILMILCLIEEEADSNENIKDILGKM